MGPDLHPINWIGATGFLFVLLGCIGIGTWLGLVLLVAGAGMFGVFVQRTQKGGAQ